MQSIPVVAMEAIFAELTERMSREGEWSGAHIKRVVALAYDLVTQVVERVVQARALIKEGQWGAVDELALEAWITLRDGALVALFEALGQVAWVELMDRVDEVFVLWLTDETQSERIRALMGSVEARVDLVVQRLITELIVSSRDRTKGSPALEWLEHHEDEIQAWWTYLISHLRSLDALA